MKNQTHDSFSELYASRHEPENLRLIAETYWRIVLLCSVSAAALVILFGIWEFSSVMSIISSATTNGASQQTSPIDRTKLDQTLTQVVDRRAEFELRRGAVPALIDPAK